MQYLKFFTFVSILLLLLGGCRKYPNEPSIKRNYLLGTHHLSSYYLNGIDKTDSIKAVNSNYNMYFNKSGDYKIDATTLSEGEWSFSIDKKHLILTQRFPHATTIKYSIVNLKSRRLILKRALSNGDIEELNLYELPVIA